MSFLCRKPMDHSSLQRSEGWWEGGSGKRAKKARIEREGGMMMECRDEGGKEGVERERQRDSRH